MMNILLKKKEEKNCRPTCRSMKYINLFFKIYFHKLALNSEFIVSNSLKIIHIKKNHNRRKKILDM